MKVKLELAKCQGHGQCLVYAPEVFGFDDAEGRSVLKAQVVPDGSGTDAKVWTAIASCPEQALSGQRD